MYGLVGLFIPRRRKEEMSSKLIKRSTAGQTKKGSEEDGTEAAHILSREVFNTIYEPCKGRPYGEFGFGLEEL